MIKVYQTVQNQNNLITTIPFKGVKVQVEFTGGNVMKNIPAKFYCRDPFTMKALDESDQNGRLFRLVQVIPEAGDNQPKKAAVTQQPTQQPAPAPKPELKDEDLANIINKTGEMQQTQEPAPQPAPAPEPTPEQADGEGEGSQDGGAADKAEFENLAAAITYIACKYNEQVESESQVRKFIEEKEGRKCLIHKG